MAEVRLYAGSLAAFSGSMAQEIEKAMNELLIDDGKDPLPTADPEERDMRRRLFIAIARGVIRHIKDRQEAFVVAVDETLPDTFTPDIKVQGS